MRNGGSGGSGGPTARELARRLARLGHQVPPVAQRAEWAATLVEAFAAVEYDGHREAIIAAMMRANPRYEFRTEDAERISVYFVNWRHRDVATNSERLEPPAVACFSLPRPDDSPPGSLDL